MAAAEPQVAAQKTAKLVKQYDNPKPSPHPFAKLCANHVKVVVQQKGGNIIKGTAKWFRANYLKLTDAEIIGRENRVTVPWVLIENHAIAHLHPDGGEPDDTTINA